MTTQQLMECECIREAVAWAAVGWDAANVLAWADDIGPALPELCAGHTPEGEYKSGWEFRPPFTDEPTVRIRFAH